MAGIEQLHRRSVSSCGVAMVPRILAGQSGGRESRRGGGAQDRKIHLSRWMEWTCFQTGTSARVLDGGRMRFLLDRRIQLVS